LIEQLFNSGSHFSAYPIKVLYSFSHNLSQPVQAGVTVSTRNFKKAVQRNRVKRIMREVYRLQKMPLINAFKQHKKSGSLFFIYIGKELPTFDEVERTMAIILPRLIENLAKK
jgi:ribonuclease P protein component